MPKLPPPPTERWARIGPAKRSVLIHTPPAGLCLSAFIIARDAKGSILLGLPKAHDGWPEKGGYPKHQARQLENQGLWLLPATHLMIEESPDDAAKRIAREWAGINGTPELLMIQSHLRPWKSDDKEEKKNPGRKLNHWDICFVYALDNAKLPNKLKPWWKEMKFVPLNQIDKQVRTGRGHSDVLKIAVKSPKALR